MMVERSCLEAVWSGNCYFETPHCDDSHWRQFDYSSRHGLFHNHLLSMADKIHRMILKRTHVVYTKTWVMACWMRMAEIGGDRLETFRIKANELVANRLYPGPISHCQ